VLPIIEEIERAGITSRNAIAAKLMGASDAIGTVQFSATNPTPIACSLCDAGCCRINLAGPPQKPGLPRGLAYQLRYGCPDVIPKHTSHQTRIATGLRLPDNFIATVVLLR
jgi:hypothetical protein